MVVFLAENGVLGMLLDLGKTPRLIRADFGDLVFRPPEAFKVAEGAVFKAVFAVFECLLPFQPL